MGGQCQVRERSQIRQLEHMMIDWHTTNVKQEAFRNFCLELDEFIQGRCPNLHVYGDNIISVYTRKATHAINGRLFKCLDVGTIVIDDAFRGEGLGIKVIDYMHSINPFQVTYVESLLNIGLYDRLKQERWNDVVGTVPLSVYKLRPGSLL